MCERPHEPKGRFWHGWLELPERKAGRPLGPWLDLSHKVGPGMPCASIFPKPSFRRVKERPVDPFTVTEISTVVHAGTHVDSPRHYFPEGPAFDEIPLDRLHGPGVVWRILKRPNEIITVAELEAARPKLRPGDMLAIDTGWAARVGTESYEHHPSLSTEAAEWIVEKKVKLFACDFATPDLVYHLRKPGFDWPVHHALLSQGVLVCEHLTGHAALADSHVEFFFGALSIEASDGALARVVGRLVEA